MGSILGAATFLVFGGALLDEGGDRLPHVGRAQAFPLLLGLEHEALGHRQPIGRVDRPLRALHRQRRLRGDRRRERR